MKPQSFRLKIVRALFAVTMIFNSACAAETSGGAAGGIAGAQASGDQEQLVQIIERTEASANPLEATLIKNRYRQEPYEANYEVQVPYQTTETYYEDVPYTTTETYYEDIPYTERESYTDYDQQCSQEYKCDNRPREHCGYENVCHTVPDRQCRQERLCRPVPGQQRCQEVEECGTNALGERICKTRKVCDREPDREDCDYVERCDNSSRQECTQERRCETRYENECGYESVCRSVPVTRYREVTKYRQELRTREVTKYRQEARTREVTRYRTEERCCVTKYKDVLDRQDILKVVIQMPVGSVLLPGEMEKLQVSLIDRNGILDVELKVLTEITNYKVIDKVIQGGTATLILEEIPVVIDTKLIGEKSVTGVKLKIMENQDGVIVFSDEGKKGRTQTTYEMSVKDSAGAEVGALNVVANAEVAQKFTLPNKLSFNRDHILTVKVTRQGPSLQAPISFVKTFKRPK